MSLLEIVVSFSVLVTAFLSLSSALPMGLSINKSAENTSIASYLAQSKMEEIYSTDYSSVAVGETETKNRLSENADDYLYNFQRQTEISYLDENLDESQVNQGMKKITINIYYQDSISKTEDIYTARSIISEK